MGFVQDFVDGERGIRSNVLRGSRRQHLQAVWSEGVVTAHDHSVEAHGLRHEDPIERVAIVRRKPAGSFGVGEADRECLYLTQQAITLAAMGAFVA